MVDLSKSVTDVRIYEQCSAKLNTATTTKDRCDLLWCGVRGCIASRMRATYTVTHSSRTDRSWSWITMALTRSCLRTLYGRVRYPYTCLIRTLAERLSQRHHDYSLRDSDFGYGVSYVICLLECGVSCAQYLRRLIAINWRIRGCGVGGQCKI